MQQQCQQVQVPIQGGAANVGGGVVGGVIGAALGNQIGRGDGKTVATAVGAVLGSQLGPQPAQASGYELRQLCNNVPVQIHQSQTPNSSELGVLFLQALQTPAERCGLAPKPADHGV